MKFVLCLSTVLCLAISGTSFANDTGKALDGLKSALQKGGEPKLDGTAKVGDETVPVLFFGSKKINANYDVVDNIKKKFGGTATIFVASGDDFVRVSTNVLKDDGTRAVGTKLARNKAYDAVKKGEKFCGEVEILNAPYDTCYEPIKDAKGTTLGIYYVGYKK